MSNIFCTKFLFISMLAFGLLEANQKSEIQFSMVEDKSMEEFEKTIAYFFGTSQPEVIKEYYVKALKKLEEIGSDSPISLAEREVTPYLEEAYKEIARQRNWDFNPSQAAVLELKIMLCYVKGENFDTIINLMIELYAHVFQSDSNNIHKAAMIRTFLYQYKVDLLKKEQKISQEEMKMMISLARTSEQLLNAIK